MDAKSLVQRTIVPTRPSGWPRSTCSPSAAPASRTEPFSRAGDQREAHEGKAAACLASESRQILRACLLRTHSDFEQIDCPLQQQIIQLLTGMSPEQLRELGLQVDFFDTKNAKFIATYE